MLSELLFRALLQPVNEDAERLDCIEQMRLWLWLEVVIEDVVELEMCVGEADGLNLLVGEFDWHSRMGLRLIAILRRFVLLY